MILETLRKLSKKVVKPNVTWDDNKYEPKVQSTFTPERKSFNDTWQDIHRTNNKFKGIK